MTTHNPAILYRYSVPYARRDGTTRTYRRTVTARDPDDARQMVAILDPAYSHTVPPGPRRGAEVLAEARAELEQGTATFDAPDGTACNEPGHVKGCAGRVGGDHELEDWETRKARYDAEMEADLIEFHGSIR